ncbi:MAG: L,D-transpeptidase [Gemmatimonadetes bacterium]|nr:L,D-transpeptidase [Gemmatimonadota bacterium]
MSARTRHRTNGRARLRAGFAASAVLLALGAGIASPAAAQARFLDAPLDPGRAYIVIRLAENRLDLVDGAEILWSAPVATGTGFRLEGAGESWEFDTPRGLFRVERKEKDPVWIMPDWAFVERGERVPPPDSPRRRRKGVLGSTALYIGHELAIHGTENPDLVLNPDPDARRVSHGCIRMTDEDARRLFHEVEVGTLVLIY